MEFFFLLRFDDVVVALPDVHAVAIILPWRRPRSRGRRGRGRRREEAWLIAEEGERGNERLEEDETRKE